MLLRVEGTELALSCVAAAAVLVGVAAWFENGSPGGATFADPAVATLGAVSTGAGLVALVALALGWRPGSGRTAWPSVAVGAAGLAGLELAVGLAVADRFFLPGVLVPVLVVAALVGRSRPTPLDGARHGVLVAGAAAVVLLVPLGYDLTVGRSGVALTGAVGIAGFLVPLAACCLGAIAGGLGGSPRLRRGGRARRT